MGSWWQPYCHIAYDMTCVCCFAEQFTLPKVHECCGTVFAARDIGWPNEQGAWQILWRSKAVVVNRCLDVFREVGQKAVVVCCLGSHRNAAARQLEQVVIIFVVRSVRGFCHCPSGRNKRVKTAGRSAVVLRFFEMSKPHVLSIRFYPRASYFQLYAMTQLPHPGFNRPGLSTGAAEG